MKNSFNIEVCFHECPLEPFEWEDVSFINGIKVLRVSTKCLMDLLQYEGKVYVDSRILLISDAKSSAVLRLDSKGKVIKRSFLLFNKDLDVSEYASNIKLTKLEYEVTSKKIKYPIELSEEKQIKSFLLDEIDKMGDINKLKYLYYLYFEDLNNYKKEKLISAIKSDDLKRSYLLYKFLTKNQSV